MGIGDWGSPSRAQAPTQALRNHPVPAEVKARALRRSVIRSGSFSVWWYSLSAQALWQ